MDTSGLINVPVVVCIKDVDGTEDPSNVSS